MRCALSAVCAVTLALVLDAPPRATGAAAGARPAGLAAPARVVTDRWGIPHLQAASLSDLYWLWGWVTARDRLSQIVEQRAAAQGRLHRWFGNDELRADGGAQLFELRERADAIWARDRRDPVLRGALERYADGINAWLAACREGRRPWPPELEALHDRPADWRPEDTVALLLGLGVTLDLDLPELGEDRQLREHGAAWFARRHRFEDRLEFDTIPDSAAGPARRGPAHAAAGAGAALPGATGLRAAALAAAWGIRSADGSDRASNAMVVGPGRAARGRPLLANDPHLALTAPGPFHVVHLSVPGVLEAAGAAVPGLPAIVSGRNTRCAWGVTALSADVIDVYADTLSADGRRVRGPHGWADVRTRPYDLTYRLFGIPLPVLGQLRRYTPHGPVVVWDPARRLALAVRWSALEDGRITLGRLVGIERSRSAAEVAERYRSLVTPAINVMTADVDGDARYQATGLVPRRVADPGPGVLPGDGRHEWPGFIPADSMPAWRVPTGGYAVNGNNRPVRAGSPYAWPRYDWPHDRATRMAQRLAGDRSVTLADLMSVQNDVVSRAAARQVPALLAALGPRAAALDARERAELDSLRAWHLDARRDRVGPTIARAWWNAYVRRSRLEGVPGLALALLTGEAHDPLRSPEGAIEGAPEAAAGALRMATDTLAARLGPDPAGWTWARAHRARFRSRLAAHGFGARFQPPLVPADGDGSTVCVGGSAAPWDFTFGHGPAFRHVVDLADSLTSWVVIPPWNSAAAGRRGASQLADWANHAYVPLCMDWARVERDAAATERLGPAAAPGPRAGAGGPVAPGRRGGPGTAGRRPAS